MRWQIETASLDCLTIRLFDQIDEANMPWLLAADERLRAAFGDQLIDLVPAYTTLMLHYDLLALDDAAARALVHEALTDLQPAPAATGALHRIPVWYDPSVGPDLARLTRLSGLAPADIIRRHCARDYQVFALGFAPGFAYMGLVEQALATPRLNTPRRRVAQGSVGIAERQTAIYPAPSPGGWNLLGRTPVQLFDLDRNGFSLLRPGDRVRFEAIERSEFLRLGGDDSTHDPTQDSPA
jgi:5-oxoprolinase (ATP-hydrolysing) subunit B